MSVRELLELAAKAAGLKIHEQRQAERDALRCPDAGLWVVNETTCWNPLTDDGDALRLAVKCGIDLRFPGPIVQAASDSMPRAVTEDAKDDPYAATRRAIVRAAAEIGRSMA